MLNGKIGVGFAGAGPVTQAIHLPTLARLAAMFEVVHVSDVVADVATAVASRVGATPSTSIGALLDDPRVEVVAVCSPHAFHAAQVIATCRAGKKAVLCEKPLAMSGPEATEIAAVSAETGMPIIVGAMHMFDPGWLAASEHWGDLPAASHTIRSSVVLPPNARFEDLATELPARSGLTAPDLGNVEGRARMVHAGVMGLAIHDLPLVRSLLPRFDDLRVLSAHVLRPFGYQIVCTAGGKLVELHATMTATWRPEWTLEAFGDDRALRIDFTPSYVHAGSATAAISTGGRTRTFGPAGHNGYEGEWLRLGAIVRGEQAAPDLAALIDDLTFAIAVADEAALLVRSAHGAEVPA